jgi:hypothetical protein
MTMSTTITTSCRDCLQFFPAAKQMRGIKMRVFNIYFQFPKVSEPNLAITNIIEKQKGIFSCSMLRHIENTLLVVAVDVHLSNDQRANWVIYLFGHDDTKRIRNNQFVSLIQLVSLRFVNVP